MKYVEANRIIGEIDKIIESLKLNCDIESNIETLELVKTIIDEIGQEEPTPPYIEEESHKIGWLDYGLIISEIGLHRYNAIHRINKHKDKFDPLAVPDLYHVAEYYKSVGTELTCCCLQAYCKDFFFTKDELSEI